MEIVEVIPGNSPVVLGMPHTGTWVPDGIASQLNTRGAGLADTDWHIHRLYEGLLPGATVVRALFHRYVIDANRDPTGASLYPGQNTTGLVPLTDFDGQNIWQEAPGEDDIEMRRAAYHEPYHAALKEQIERVQAQHGLAVLYDCHSIRSHIPHLFEGTLPDFNIGDNNGATCSNVITKAAAETCEAAAGYTSVTNGRFRGGWTTRAYGQPREGVHAIQMELAQSTYMIEAAPWDYLPDRANQTRTHLKTLLRHIETLALDGELT